MVEPGEDGRHTRTSLTCPCKTILARVASRRAHLDTFVDSYLEIAQKVLRRVRKPMTARGILDAAYRANLVPTHLYGKTQHKTLQARISEDILYHRSTSAFFRTRPGVFFLSELITDPDVPNSYKEPFSARRRTRDLYREPLLTLDRHFLNKCSRELKSDWRKLAKAAESVGAIKYAAEDEVGDDLVTTWTFSVVRKGNSILSYRIGRYRDDRDAFADKKSIGFKTTLDASDLTLFCEGDYGAKEKSLSVILNDLDISYRSIDQGDHELPTPMANLVLDDKKGQQALLIVMEWTCPEWFEPTTRRLSLNNLTWLDLKSSNKNLDDFEPWSKAAFEALHYEEL